jgi:hypothetical protein
VGIKAPDSQYWRQEWPTTDFTKHVVALSGIKSGGPSKDGIPAIDSPRFEQLEAGRASGLSCTIDRLKVGGSSLLAKRSLVL